MNLLIVEDSELIAQRMHRKFEEISEITSIRIINNGIDAFAEFEKLNPDLVILDISLPGKDGIDLLKEFKEIHPGTIVFIFTNFPYKQYKDSCLKLGAESFFDKSSDFELLVEKVELYAKDHLSHQKKLIMNKILVVDDSSTMRKMIIASLRTIPGLSFTESSSGLEAIEQLAIQRFNAIMLDMNMPDINGLEVLQFIRSQNFYRQIPVIVLTTRSDESSKTSAIQAGATVYLTKPFEPKQLAITVETLLNQTHHG